MLEGAYDVAIKHFTDALDLKPGLIHALVSRGFCHLTLGDEEKAQRDFAEVIAKDAGFNRNVYVLIALCFKRHGNYHQAIRYLSRCVQQFASFKPALVARGELSLKVREYEKARMDFQQVLQKQPSHLVARRGLGDALRGLGNFRESLRQYTKAIEDALRELSQQSRKVDSNLESIMSGNISEEAGNSLGSRASAGRDGAISGGDFYVGINDDFSGANSRIATFHSLEEGSDDFSGANCRSPRSDEGAGDGDMDPSRDLSAGAEQMVRMQDESVHGTQAIQAFATEVLLRRALLLRLIGDLEGSSQDLLQVLTGDNENGLALFWYAKVLIEQHRHREAPAFLTKCLFHFEDIRDRVHALQGALLLTRPDPDCDLALRHLTKAVKLSPPGQPERSQPIKITMWICAAANALHSPVNDPQTALSYLDKSLAALNNSPATGAKGVTRAPTGSQTQRSRSPLGGGTKSARAAGATPRVAVGSGGNAVALLSAGSKSIEEATWLTARNLVRRRQELAQGDDLDLALECSTYLQLVAREPQQQMSSVPPLLYALRAVACCSLGRFEDCQADCRKALALDPNDEATQYNMHVVGGILRSQAQEYVAAVGHFTKAIRLQPVSNEVRVHRAIALALAARACTSTHVAPNSPDQDGGRAMQLLSDAVQNLEAAEQQAMISGGRVPPGTSRLRAACLCNLGRPDEAWELLQTSQSHSRGSFPESPRHRALEAEVLVLLERHSEAIQACSHIINTPDTDHVSAHLMRGRCWSELGNAENAFEDFRAAATLAPERADVHEATGELFHVHANYSEAITAFNTSAKLAGNFTPRLAYSRALAHLALGNPGLALKDLNRALRLNPNLPVASRARDGSAALQMALDGDYRHAHVRLNVLLHPRAAGSSNPMIEAAGASQGLDGLPQLFLNHELVLYRGVCYLYLGDSAAAAQDFEAAFELAQQTFQALQQTGRCYSDQNESADHSASTASLAGGGDSDRQSAGQYPPEVMSQTGQDTFECEMMYNITICHLMAKDHRAALATCERLLGRPDALALIGPSAQCLIWFLVGVCRLALGEGRSDVAREAFMHSYAHDPVYVDDFLRRHEPTVERGYGGPNAGMAPVRSSSSGNSSARNPQFRPVGGPTPRLQPSRDICDAAAEAVCCLRREKSRLSSRFPPCRLQVKDVVIWSRPSVHWPHVRTPELVPAASLARLDILSHLEVGVNPAPPWGRLG